MFRQYRELLQHLQAPGRRPIRALRQLGSNCDGLSAASLNEKIEIRERCKGVHYVELDESFPTTIYLQNLALIQPRTSPKSSKVRAIQKLSLNFKILNLFFAAQSIVDYIVLLPLSVSYPRDTHQSHQG